MSVNPKQPTLKTGLYGDEPGIAGDFAALSQFFATKKLRPSRSSPPIANDVGELEFIIDKATKKLWTKIDGVLYSVTFS